jgi:hypothetical protein
MTRESQALAILSTDCKFFKGIKGSDFSQALCINALNGELDRMRVDIAFGADIHYENDKALRYAASRGHEQVIRFLIDQGANIHAGNNGALRVSASSGHDGVVIFLLDRGANIHAEDDEALRHSACNGHIKIVELLLDRGANIHAENDDALRSAVVNDEIEIVRLLLDRGANIHANDDEALLLKLSLGYHVNLRQLETIRLLLDNGASLCYRDVYWLTQQDIMSVNLRRLIKMVILYKHINSTFVDEARMCGLLRRHVHRLEELCRKRILLYSKSLPEKIEWFNCDLAIKMIRRILKGNQ